MFRRHYTRGRVGVGGWLREAELGKREGKRQGRGGGEREPVRPDQPRKEEYHTERRSPAPCGVFIHVFWSRKKHNLSKASMVTTLRGLVPTQTNFSTSCVWTHPLQCLGVTEEGRQVHSWGPPGGGASHEQE